MTEYSYHYSVVLLVSVIAVQLSARSPVCDTMPVLAARMTVTTMPAVSRRYAATSASAIPVTPVMGRYAQVRVVAVLWAMLCIPC